jgi:collagenase-like PrtC family protease
MRQNKIRNFDTLKKTIDDLHSLGVKAYLTINIFPRNTDIKVIEAVIDEIS